MRRGVLAFLAVMLVSSGVASAATVGPWYEFPPEAGPAPAFVADSGEFNELTYVGAPQSTAESLATFRDPGAVIRVEGDPNLGVTCVALGDNQAACHYLPVGSFFVPIKIELGDLPDRYTGVSVGPDQAPADFGQAVIVYGGPGNDVLRAGGLHSLYGGFGADRLLGGSSSDKLIGDPGADILIGGGGDDFLLSGRGKDRLNGDAGGDSLLGGPGADLISGGAGDDLVVGTRTELSGSFSGDRRADTLRCGPGDDLAIADRKDRVSVDCEHVVRPHRVVCLEGKFTRKDCVIRGRRTG